MERERLEDEVRTDANSVADSEDAVVFFGIAGSLVVLMIIVSVSFLVKIRKKNVTNS